MKHYTFPAMTCMDNSKGRCEWHSNRGLIYFHVQCCSAHIAGCYVNVDIDGFKKAQLCGEFCIPSSCRVSKERCTLVRASVALTWNSLPSRHAPMVPARPRPPQQCMYSVCVLASLVATSSTIASTLSYHMMSKLTYEANCYRRVNQIVKDEPAHS